MGKKRVIKEKESERAEEAAPKEVVANGKEVHQKRAARLASSRIYISASYNNTLISITDSEGAVLVWSSAGAMGFKGPKKATPYAASKVVENVFEKLGVSDLGKVSVYVEGVGSGRDAAIRAIAGRGINIFSLKDITPIPHNGCRARKARRV